MKLEVGKKYKNSYGDIYEVIAPLSEKCEYDYVAVDKVGRPESYTKDGVYDHECKESYYNLREEYEEPKTKDVWIIMYKRKATDIVNIYCCISDKVLNDYKSRESLDMISIKKVTLTEGEFDE